MLQIKSQETIRACRKKLTQDEKLIMELDRLSIRIYENNVAERMSNERFAMMSQNYKNEQAQFKAEVQKSQWEIEVPEQQIDNMAAYPI